MTEAALGASHPDTAVRPNNLAGAYRALGRTADARPLHERALAIAETSLGPDHPTTAIRLDNLASTYRDLGRPADALPLQRRALTITETALGTDHPTTATGSATSRTRITNSADPPTPSPFGTAR